LDEKCVFTRINNWKKIQEHYTITSYVTNQNLFPLRELASSPVQAKLERGPPDHFDDLSARGGAAAARPLLGDGFTEAQRSSYTPRSGPEVNNGRSAAKDGTPE